MMKHQPRSMGLAMDGLSALASDGPISATPELSPGGLT
jgi:hypothetical protein